MDDTTHANRLKEWYANFIPLFREEFSKLSKEERKHITSWHDYHSPCQIEVFWLKRPNWQLIVETHLENRPDGQVVVNGPYDNENFQDEVSSVLNESRWKIQTDSGKSQYSDAVAEQLHRFVFSAKNALFMDWQKLNGFTQILNAKNYRITHFHGNMADFNYRAYLQHIIRETKQQIEEYNAKPVSPQTKSPKIEYPKGFATYFYPPIIVDGNPKRSPEEIFQGVKSTNISTFDKDLFEIMFDDILVLVERDGFIGVCTDVKKKSLDILNTIMMISILDGLEATVVREHELSDIEYIPESKKITSRSYSYNSPRNKLFDGIPDKTMEFETRYVEKENIKKIFDKASKIFLNKSLAEDLRILLDATTHMKDSEFSQSFIESWKIIEKHLKQKWSQKSPNKTKFPTSETMITDLKDELKENFSIFTDLRKIRNNIMHGPKDVTKQESQKCYDISKEFVLKNSNFNS
ncbi:MAG: hypothetical protein KGZ37_10515 [Nitrosarchaeum sp.]|nr:hypothetical protein [Nitrosarchaeum sp.]